MLSALDQSILAALVYFNLFDYPLTLLELRRYLLFADQNGGDANYSLGQIDQAWRSSARLRSLVCFQKGFFYLRGRAEIIDIRAARFFIARRKYKRAQKITRWLSSLPFVRLVAVCNSLAYSQARDQSDIDLFIITKPGGVWWARFFCALFLALLRLRPRPGDTSDKICLSFFVDSQHWQLETLKLGTHDIYLPLWLATLYPLYDAGGCYQRFWETNSWMRLYLPGAVPVRPHPARLKQPAHVGRYWRYSVEWFCQPFTFLIVALQRYFFSPDIKALANLDTRVRIADGMLKLHTNDRRKIYARRFFAKLELLQRAN